MRSLALLLLLALPAAAHEVSVDTHGGQATVLSLRYADGQPFAFEAYELYPANSDIPGQVGRTDARGRVIFLADGQTSWRLKAWSADGHGVDRQITATPGDAATMTLAAAPARSSLWLAGLGSIFGLFGVWQLFLRRKQK